MQVQHIATPLGQMIVVWSTYGLCLLEFADQAQLSRELNTISQARKGQWAVEPNWHIQLQDELADYFAGVRQQFTVPLDPIGTPFQLRAWQALCAIEYGNTWSYKQQAQYLGNKKASRAVAAANGQNKISIIIPCHRVIGSNGTLTGYAGGLARKKFLLELERNIPNNSVFGM